MSSDLILLEIRLVLCLQAFWTSFLLHLLHIPTTIFPSKHLSKFLRSINSIRISSHSTYPTHKTSYAHRHICTNIKICGKYFKERVWSVKGCISSSASAVAFDMSAWYFDLFSHWVQQSAVRKHTLLCWCIQHIRHLISPVHSQTQDLHNTDIPQPDQHINADGIHPRIWLTFWQGSLKVMNKHP